MKLKNPMRSIIILFTLIVIVYPVIPLFIQSIAGDWDYRELFPSSLTLDNYISIIDTYNIPEVTLNSIIISSVVVVISLILGIFPAKYIGTRDFRGKTWVQVLTMMPVMAPGIIVLFGIGRIFAELGIYRTYMSLILSEVVFLIPYMIMVLVPVFKNYDRGIEDQAATLGVGRLSTLMNVTFPSIRSGVAVACMYVFISSWATYLAVGMYAPIDFETMGLIMYPAIKFGQVSDSMLAALTIIFFIPSVLFLLISTWIMGTDKVNNQRV
ncbi:MAG: ABC transporter permease subunit [Candidatus Methanomethylophilaceae archaeon]|uniref:ABC transporter permease n=1 Tax=Candidatus Methanarcanum hacksteinii TaxID=2911857 RepID=UPI002A7C1099|nr:ABC transporter permease subunit [Candidatus Methanomethylophilaceae archaeon]